MQRFADRPYSTWRNIELALSPYKQRLGRRAMKQHEEISKIMDLFSIEEFTNDKPLKGEFLLGYYCELSYLKNKNKKL
jgi:CRISPR-associated protein Csd1